MLFSALFGGKKDKVDVKALQKELFDLQVANVKLQDQIEKLMGANRQLVSDLTSATAEKQDKPRRGRNRRRNRQDVS